MKKVKVLVFLLACLSSTVMFGQLHYSVDGTGCEGTITTVTGVLKIDGVEVYNGVGMQNAGGGQLEIGVFDENGICRGAKMPTWRSKSNQWVYQLQCRGYANLTYPTFKVYDHATETELDLVLDIEDVITWTSGGKYGSLNNLYPINFTNPNAGYTKHIEGYAASYNVETNPNGNYYLIASPLAGSISPSAIAGMTEGEFDLYYFDQTGDEEQKEWITYKDGGNGFAMQSGAGYLYAHGTDIDLTFSGNAYEGDGTVALTYDGDALWSGWNLVGNPFTVEAYADRSYYALQNGSELVPTEASVAVGAMDGIFVQAADENDNQMSFSTEAPDAAVPTLALNVSRDSKVVDRAVVSFGQERTLPKFQLNPSHTKVYIPQDNRDYAVVTAEEMGEMPVSFKAERNGRYTLDFTAREVSFAYLHLIDNKTGKDIDLLESPAYSFDALTTDYANRFKLVFATGNATDDNFAFCSNGNWIISNDGEATLQVIDVNGRILSSETVSGCVSKAISAAPGVYMLRLINGDNMKVQKVVVK